MTNLFNILDGVDENIIVLPSAVRAATNASADFEAGNATGLNVFFNISVVPGVQTVTLTIQGKDPLSGTYYTLLAGAAQIGVAFVSMTIYPGLTAAGNLAANAILSDIWRVNIVHSGGTNFTYSVSADLIR